jgi:hypothetical protein
LFAGLPSLFVIHRNLTGILGQAVAQGQKEDTGGEKDGAFCASARHGGLLCSNDGIEKDRRRLITTKQGVVNRGAEERTTVEASKVEEFKNRNKEFTQRARRGEKSGSEEPRVQG